MDTKSSPNSRGLRALELNEQGKTLNEIGNILGVSRARVQRIILQTKAEVESYRKFEELKELCASLHERPQIPAAILGLTIDYLNLSPKASNCLKSVSIKTVGDLISKTSIHLAKIKYMGKKTIIEILFILDEVGLTLADTSIRFYQRRLPSVSASMRSILTKRGWSETVYREWKFGYDGEPMNWEDAAILELQRRQWLKI